jgi:hypothetical protein
VRADFRICAKFLFGPLLSSAFGQAGRCKLSANSVESIQALETLSGEQLLQRDFAQEAWMPSVWYLSAASALTKRCLPPNGVVNIDQFVARPHSSLRKIYFSVLTFNFSTL